MQSRMAGETSVRGADFKAKSEAWRQAVENALHRFTPASEIRPERLHRAMRYSLEAGGKRLRPILLLAAAEVFSAKSDPLPAAVAIECLHTYSLIHDDLPGIDDGDLRRGRPTCHRQFDEATAILAGDALLTHAFALLAESYAARPELAVGLIRELGEAAGSRRLIGGQMEDILAESGEGADEERLEFIHTNKTAALISAALAMGARLGQADEAGLAAAREVGRLLGLCFQIVDDILDATGTSEALGKTAGSDARGEKSTYPRLLGLEQSRQRARELTQAAVDACAALPGDTSFLRETIRSLEHRIR
jgi:geranylgeranyl diphosphate synthase, type II